MSLPPQPPNPPSRGSAPGDSPPRAGARDTGPKPPADSVDEAQTLHTAAEREDEAPQTGDSSPRMPRLGQPPRGKRIRRKSEAPPQTLTAEQRLLLLDTWRRSGLPAGDFAALVGLSKYTLYAWKHKFEAEGPAGLEDKPRGGTRGSRLPEVTKRAILMLKQDNPDWGCERISALLLRGRRPIFASSTTPSWPGGGPRRGGTGAAAARRRSCPTPTTSLCGTRPT